MRATASLLVVSVLGLAACSETGSDGNVSAYNSKISTHSNPLISELNASTATALTATPVEGYASMTGTFLLQTPAGMTGIDKFVGQIDMSADFAAETVSGTMYRFVETYTNNTATGIDGSASYTGTIDIDTGTNDDVTASGSGFLTTTKNQEYTLNTTMNGDFYRRAGGDLASAGIMSATASGAGSTHGLVGTYHVTE